MTGAMVVLVHVLLAAIGAAAASVMLWAWGRP
jgi:hypothetical protein